MTSHFLSENAYINFSIGNRRVCKEIIMESHTKFFHTMIGKCLLIEMSVELQLCVFKFIFLHSISVVCSDSPSRWTPAQSSCCSKLLEDSRKSRESLVFEIFQWQISTILIVNIDLIPRLILEFTKGKIGFIRTSLDYLGW